MDTGWSFAQVKKVLEVMNNNHSFEKIDKFIEKLVANPKTRLFVENLARRDSGLIGTPSPIPIVTQISVDMLRIQLKAGLTQGWYDARTDEEIEKYGGRRRTRRRNRRT